MAEVKIHDKHFKTYIPHEKVLDRIRDLGGTIEESLSGKTPVFLGVLNGAFRFASDLLGSMNTDCEINFIRVQSYSGTKTTGNVREMIGLNADISGREVIIIEDIVDTGHTLTFLLEMLEAHNPASIRIATLLFKPDAYLKEGKPDFIGFEIPNLFVVGYGLDYDGLGRNLNDIYQII